MKTRAINAIKALLDKASEGNYTIKPGDMNLVIRFESGASIHVNQLSTGRWILASWNTGHHQWVSTDFSASFARINPSARYCVARNIEALVGDCKTYRSPVDAVRSALKR